MAVGPAASPAATPLRGPDDAPEQPHPQGVALPDALGVLGVGALASAMVLALQRARPGLQFHCAPRNAQAVAALQARALLAVNMADVAQLLALHPGKTAAELARDIGSPGTYTAAGLDHLQAVQAHQPWLDALALVMARMPRAG